MKTSPQFSIVSVAAQVTRRFFGGFVNLWRHARPSAHARGWMPPVPYCRRPPKETAAIDLSEIGATRPLPRQLQDRAFTLIEIMIAIGILAMVLAAIYSTW